jgi:cyclophilin family peptidyl-prolyl cis-trans isomerase
MRSALALLILSLSLVADAARAQCVLDPGGQPVVELRTSLGTICIELFPDAPGFTETVPNFLGYVNRGDYDGTFFHRSARTLDGQPFVIQGGGFAFEAGEYSFLCADGCPTVVNEFAGVSNLQNCGPGRPDGCNVRGTLAMAKLGGDVDSATSQWFINLRDTNRFLDDVLSGEFTIFGRVVTGMDVVDAIAALPRLDGEFVLRTELRGALSELPLLSTLPASCFDLDDVALVFAGPTCTDVLEPDPVLGPSFLYFVSPVCFDAPAGCPGEPRNLAACRIVRAPNGQLFFRELNPVPLLSSCEAREASDAAQQTLATEVPERLVEISRAFVVPEPGTALSGLAALATLALLARRYGELR